MSDSKASWKCYVHHYEHNINGPSTRVEYALELPCKLYVDVICCQDGPDTLTLYVNEYMTWNCNETAWQELFDAVRDLKPRYWWSREKLRIDLGRMPKIDRTLTRRTRVWCDETEEKS